jgi:3-hydroxyisobutyrate dehydrogenase-like beta-hydroxyacid dehydrogenase
VIVGVIGLGKMGRPMTENLLKAGFEVVVHNRSRAVVDELAQQGAIPASSAAEVAQRSDVVLTVLPTLDTVESIFLGGDGLIDHARPNQILIDHSTVSPQLSRTIAVAAAEKSAGFLDVPVSGGPAGARGATLTMMAGGERTTFDAVQPVLSALGKNIHYCGPSGSGTIVKLVNQLLVGVHTAAAAEALVFGTKAGADPQVLLDVIGSSFGGSTMLNRNTPLVLQRKFDPATSIRLILKDLGVIRELGGELDTRLLMTGLAEQLFIEARGLGYQDNDMSAMVLPLENIAGIEVRSSKS